MGLGDEVIVTAHAKRMQQSNPLPVAVIDKRGRRRSHPIWFNNPRIAAPEYAGEVQTLDMRGGNRPYIDYMRSTPDRWQWKTYQCEPGEIYLTADERANARLASDAIIFEPNIKQGAPSNKRWNWEYWQTLADKCAQRGLTVVQMGSEYDPRLRGVKNFTTRDFRQACGILSGARAIVTHEGALHHAAAALSIPAVVIRGGFIGPTVTGYDGQFDFFLPTEKHPIGCGFRIGCAHCAAIMDAIKPRTVLLGLLELIGETE